MRVRTVSPVRQVDAGEPEPGRLELRRRRQHLLALPEPVEALGSGPLEDAPAERLAALVVLAVEVETEESLDKAIGLAALEAVALHRLVDLAVRADHPRADAVEDAVGVALDDRRERLQRVEHRALAVGLHRAEQGLGPLGDARERRRVGRVDVAEARLERTGIDLVRGDVVDREPYEA